ncbi:pilus assembly protein [Geomonas edaphica]|uniref:pilus assembly protein n=1 Tax=Geomonas edaphica TaxID=2570226 RepID=UPI001FE727C7|nr:PilC/PilY family type IV pilus protein [Geomonas edaphica]
MKNSKRVLAAASLFALSFALQALPAHAQLSWPGEPYCVKPAFVAGNIPPNLLLMIDNSASMYDLAYVDEGMKHCSNNSAKVCTENADCPGGTCSVFDRRPFYCYDQTFDSTKPYYGYFNKDKFYYYYKKQTDGTGDEFRVVAGSTLADALTTVSCGTNAANTTKTFPGQMCLEYTSAKSLVAFVAKGSYLNWLTASKLDTEKQILTGGVFDGSALKPQSRGCVGQPFVKDQNASNFVNFSDGTPDPNTSLEVTYTITGEPNPYNPTAPATGGQTYINLFGGAAFNYSNCQDAITSIASGGNADIKQDVSACLASTAPATGTCRTVPAAFQPFPACATSSDCYLNKASTSSYICQKYLNKTCTGLSDTTSCSVAARNSCSVDPTIACSTDANCLIDVPAKNGTCSTSKSMYTPTPGSKDTPPGNACVTDTDCKFKSTGTNFTPKTGACVGYVAATTANKGPCISTSAADYGPCVANYVGDCVLTAQGAATKTKVSFQQSMQECWTIRGETHTAADGYGFPNMNTVLNQCPDIYASYKTCHNDHLKQCTVDTDCAADGTVTCDSGPSAIGPGNPALLCGTNYEGTFFTKDTNGNWVVTATGAANSYLAMKEAEYRFCGDMTAPPVTDPTDSPSDTALTDNMPAILSGIGVEAQLGAPIQTMRARVAATSCSTVTDCASIDPDKQFACTGGICQPIGLIQEFASKIRLGFANFNPFGSASETTTVAGVKPPKVCYVGSTGTTPVDPLQSCTLDRDCGSANHCGDYSSSDLDGGRIVYPVGQGLCATMTTTACVTDGQCSLPNKCLNGYCGTKGTDVCTSVMNCTGSSQACIRDDAGDHITSNTLVKKIDDIRAISWTPLAETLYDVLGYFAAIPQNDNTLKSRVTGAATGITGLRINTSDFNEVLHPSEYRCQQNYLLLLSDGSSTADRNTPVGNLATLYATQAGTTAGACTVPSGEVDHGGTSNLPIMSWIGRRQNLASFSTSAVTPLHCSGHTSTVCTKDTDCPTGESCQNGVYPRDYFTTYVVFNGEDTGTTDVCSAANLLGKTASNGGTTLQQANNPKKLRDSLSTIFQNIAAKASSGTAASILSNSEGSGANILQAVFFPKKVFYNQTSTNWIGEMQNLWYFVDPQISRSTIREDTDQNRVLDLIADHVVNFRFDSTDNTTYAYTSIDNNGDGIGDTAEVKEDTDYVKSIWRAGKQLWARDITATGGARKIKTSINGTSLIDFSSSTFTGDSKTDNSAALAPYLNVSTGEATRLINYVHGLDQDDATGMASYRKRKVTIKDPISGSVDDGIWRLGDIISSTPRIQSTGKLNTYNLVPSAGYNDVSYASFVGSSDYKSRGTVYVGANDGMLHAFKLGLLDVTASNTQKATLSGDGLGEEQWAYIPKQALPYLKFYGDPDYSHLYYVDGATLLFDASIGSSTACSDAATYYDCVKPNAVTTGAAGTALDPAANTWRTILIGGMGIGGASGCASGAPCVATPLAADPSDGTKALGYSTYFALDVTDPNTPSLMWEFNDTSMGYATTGPAIVRVGDRAKNGHWYAVFGSGPTGKIDTINSQFMGQSSQTLKFFIVDLRSGKLLRTIDTGIPNAFAGSMLGGSIDADRWNSSANGHYQDDAIYIGYTKKNTTTNTWSDGGVVRIMTKETDTVANWEWSEVVRDTGPVVTSISRLQDRKNKHLWLYFGSGRYYYRAGKDIDDFTNQRSIYGIKDPCYNTDANPGNLIDKTCKATVTSGITDQSTSIATDIGDGGWKIDLDGASGDFGAERIVTDAVALTNGTVFLTSFMPTADPCGFGGNSFLWAVGYDTGGRPSDAALTGKALIQLSTGEFKEIDLQSAFGSGAARLLRRTGVPMTGKPPADAFPIVSKSGNKPVKRIMHIQER